MFKVIDIDGKTVDNDVVSFLCNADGVYVFTRAIFRIVEA